ncbi:hypothetical protein PIROE2DRAFT_17195, partial [Piromyces sp. E2]
MCLELGIEFNKEDEKEFDMVKSTTTFLKTDYMESKQQHSIMKSASLCTNTNNNTSVVGISDNNTLDDDLYRKYLLKCNPDLINKPNYLENLIIFKIINKKKENQSFTINSLRSSIIRIVNEKTSSRKSSISKKEYDNDEQNKYLLKISIFHNKSRNKLIPDYNFVQNSNGLWAYSCNLESTDLVFNVIDFFILLVVSIRGKNIINYKLIFKCTQNITYSSVITIILGPLAN